MKPTPLPNIPDPTQVTYVATTLSALANQQRLLILCYLSQAKETSVSDLNEQLALSQSALSQHLAKLRKEGIIEARKDGLKVYYKISRSDILALLQFLHQEYCS